MADLTGTQLAKYQIEERLSRGAMGEIYKAFHPALERTVAIKVIHPHFVEEPAFVDRFRREAKIVAALRHPAIVQVYDFDIEKGIVYMVMEFVPGESLQAHLAQLHQQGERLPLNDALSLFRTVVEAVAYAHEHGVIHRDIKPANVLLTPEGQPILADFGLSKIIGTERIGSGIIVGTPTYMSPEQGSGQAGDERSDIYSLGVMLYELTTGILPFSGDTAISTILKHLDDPLPPPRSINPDLPAAVEQIIVTALEKEPANRFQTARALLAALAEPELVALTPARLLIPPEDQRCPYRGLQAFEAEHAEFYFGREALVQQLAEKIEAFTNPTSPPSPRFLAVIGPSGSGKSSLVRAGLIPALQSEAGPDRAKWMVQVMQPGNQPLVELAARLATTANGDVDASEMRAQLLAHLRADGRTLHRLANEPADHHLLLVVDQFEEIFTLCRDEPERRAFVENLLYAAAAGEGQAMVVLTVRADFYHRCADYHDLARLLSVQQALVGPMTEAELRRAIEQPARRVGLKFEAGLVDIILADVAQQPGALPLLEHALLELWERREGHLLTLAAYQASGGVSGGIARRADALLAGFNPDNQVIVRRIMLRLTQPGEGTEDTRRRVRKQELLSGQNQQQAQAVESILQQLVAARLLTTSRDLASGQELVDVSHEALIRGWTQLRSWIDEDRAALRIHRQLTDAAGEWEQHHRDPSYLYRGSRLIQAEEWVETHASEFNELEWAFIDASRDAARAIEAEEEAVRQRELAQAQALATAEHQRAELQARAGTRLRWLAVGLALIFLVAVGAAVIAVGQRQEAQRQTEAVEAARVVAESERERAEQQANLALSRQLGAQAAYFWDKQLDLALLLSLEANRITDTIESAGDAVLGIEYDPRLARILHGHQDGVWSVAFSPDGRLFASGSRDDTIMLWDAATGEPAGPALAGHENDVQEIAFSPDGRLLASAGRDKTILWDVTTGQPYGQPLTEHTDWVNGVAFSPDGQTLATASNDNTIILWNTASGEPLGPPLTGHTEAVRSVAFSPDGRTLASSSVDSTVRLWDVATGQPVGEALTGHLGPVGAVVFSPDGKLLASGSDDQNIILWDAATGQPLGLPLTGHRGWVNDIVFSPDGQTLVSASSDHTIRWWDIANRQLVGPPLEGHTEEVRTVAFSPDGQTLVSGSAEGRIMVWEIAAARFLNGHLDWVDSVAFSPDGEILASAGDDDQIILWDVASGQPLGQPLTNHTDHVISVAFSPDGQTLASGSFDQTVILWDVASSKPLGQPLDSPDWVSDVVFSPDGQLLAAGSGDGTVLLWDAATGQPRDSLTGQTGFVSSLAFSPDGQLLASGSSDKSIIFWDTATFQPVGGPLTGHTDEVWGVAFSPDGKMLASASNDQTVRLWDVPAGEPLGRPLTGHTDQVWGVLFSPDGKILASSSRDNTIILWDVAQRRPLRPPLTSHTNWVWGMDFSPDGQLLASGSRDTKIILWQVQAGLWPATACRVANRNLSPAEWQQFIGDAPYRETCSTLLDDF